MYHDEFQTSVDSKGRITIPVHFRKIMEVADHETWYMTRGWDGSIFVVDAARWHALERQIEDHHMFDPGMLDFRRMLIGGASKTRRDNQWRLPIPQHLREYAGVEEKAVLTGVQDHLEIWSVERWRGFQERQMEQYRAVAERLFGQRGAQGAGGTAGPQSSAKNQEEVRDA